jgi:hypothetical protein
VQDNDERLSTGTTGRHHQDREALLRRLTGAIL